MGGTDEEKLSVKTKKKKCKLLKSQSLRHKSLSHLWIEELSHYLTMTKVKKKERKKKLFRFTMEMQLKDSFLLHFFLFSLIVHLQWIFLCCYHFVRLPFFHPSTISSIQQNNMKQNEMELGMSVYIILKEQKKAKINITKNNDYIFPIFYCLDGDFNSFMKMVFISLLAFLEFFIACAFFKSLFCVWKLLFFQQCMYA